MRRECLDWTLISDRRHLGRVLRTFIDHYSGHLQLRPLGGLVHEYHAAA